MEDSWLLSTLMSLTANTLISEMKETKTQRELIIVIDEMTNTLEQFGKKSNKKKTVPKESTNWKPALQQLSISLNITLTKQSQHIPKKKI